MVLEEDFYGTQQDGFHTSNAHWGKPSQPKPYFSPVHHVSPNSGFAPPPPHHHDSFPEKPWKESSSYQTSTNYNKHGSAWQQPPSQTGYCSEFTYFPNGNGPAPQQGNRYETYPEEQVVALSPGNNYSPPNQNRYVHHSYMTKGV